VTFIDDGTGRVHVKEHNFEIVYYDEQTHQYIVRPASTDTINAFYILNERMEKEAEIVKPTGGETTKYATQAYNLDTIIYFGDMNDKKFQVQKYDMQTKQWKDLAELLPQEVYEGYEGYAQPSFNTAYPDWVAFTIDMLWTPHDEADVQTEEEADRIFALSNEAFEREKEKKTNEGLADGRLKRINTVYFVNLKTGEIKQDTTPVIFEGGLSRIPEMDTSIVLNENKLVMVRMNPNGIEVINEFATADILPAGEIHINNIVQYTADDITFWTSNGLVTYTFGTGHSEYLYDISDLK